MSTKTTLKRIALVAVSAMGFGMISVAPSANAAWPTTISLGTPTANVAVVGQTSTITVTTTVSATANATDSFTVSAIPSAWPATSGVNDDTDVTAVAGSAVVAGTANYASAGTWASSLSGKTNEMTFTFSAAPSSTSYPASLTNTFTFTPDVAGSYTFAVFLDGSTTVSPTGAIKSGDTVKYVTITAVSVPATTVAMTQQLAGTGVVYADSTAIGSQGIWVRLNAKDSAGALTRLASSQLLMVTIPSGLTLRAKNNGGTTTTGLSATATDYALAASDFNSSGYAWLQFTSSAAGTYNLSSKLSDGTASAVLSLVYAADTDVATACAADAAGNPDGTDIVAGYVIAASGNQTSSTATSIASTQTSTAFTICAASADVEGKVGVRVTDTKYKIFGNTAALSQDVLVTLGDEAGDADYVDGKAYGSLTVAHAALGRITNDSLYNSFTVTPADSLTAAPAQTNTITGALATGDSDNITITPATSLKVVNGGSITFTATFANNYGVARTGLATTAQISAGRNLQATSTALVTDSAGKVTFTVTDAAPTSTTTTSTVTFSDGTYSASATITWVSSLTATTMTTSPSATSNDTSAKALSLGAVDTTGTATAGRDSITATVLDEFGAVVIGMPVTLTKPADVSYYTGSSDVAYTNSLGVATWSVYATKAGTYAFTFTGGGLTKTSYAKWTGGTARVVKAVAGTTAGDVTPVTISVEDAHGNKVPSAAVSLSATGGYFQGVPLTSSQTTNADGELVVAFVGSGTITAKISGGQSLDL
jgi:hypothetical protein